MKFSSKMEKCGLSPMRKFNGYADEAVKRGIKIYHLNIGQPDIKTPDAYFKAMREFSEPVLAYAPSAGVPALIDAVCNYYDNIGVKLDKKDILVTTGGSEALQMTMATLLDDGDEIIIPEPFYPNYHTSVTLAGATIHPLTTCPEENYRYAVRERVEACINEHTRAILVTNPGNPTGTILTPDELKLMLDIAKELKARKAKRMFAYATYPIFTKGLAKFDEAYEKGLIHGVFGTNLTYRTPELLKRPWFKEVDVSKYLAYFIASINHDTSISNVIDPHEKIKALLREHRGL